MNRLDPFGSMKNMFNQFQSFMGNPVQFLAQNKLNIPQEYLNNPNDAIQHLMNSGQLSQQQYNMAVNAAKRIEGNPQFQKFIGNQGRNALK